MYQTCDTEEPDSPRDEEPSTRYLLFIEVACKCYGGNSFHRLHRQWYAEDDARQDVGEAAEDKSAGEGDGAALGESDEDGEEGADVTKGAGDFSEWLLAEGVQVVVLDFVAGVGRILADLEDFGRVF